MPRCAQAGDSGLVAHTGGWLYCPWCGELLPPPRATLPRRRRRTAGCCTRCGGAATDSTRYWCSPCWKRHMENAYADGHTIEELAALRTAGQSWREIAVGFGLTRPRKGPEDVRTAALAVWSDAGHPGVTYDDWPDCPADMAYNAWLRSAACAPYQRARDAAIDHWLAEVAGAS